MPRRLLHYALLAFLVATAVTVPAGAANREHQQMMADIRMMQEQVQQLQLQLGGLADALKTVTAKLDEQAGAARKVVADQKLATDSISGDLRVIREKVDDNNVRLGSLGQELESLRQSLPAPGATPTGAVPPEEQPPATPPAGVAPPPPTATPAQPLPSPQRLFESAWSDYVAGQWNLAVLGFENYIKTFPKSDRAGEAQYYVGKAYLQDGKFEDALAAFNKVISTYPNDTRNVPSAYYNRGLALERLNQIPQARESYEYVLKNYPPDNQAAGLAKQALDRLSRTKKDENR